MVRRNADRKKWADEERLLRTAHAAIWEHPVDLFYTDHGFGHSERVRQLAEGLARFYSASSYERHLLRQAALLHDMGMQFDYWGAFPAEQRSIIASVLELPEPPLGAEEVRKRHVELGEKLAQADFSGRRRWMAIPPLSSDTSEAKSVLHHSSLVAFAHSRGVTWDNFHKSNATLDSRVDPFGEALRLRLLAGLFRLADELDGNYLRVPRIDQLFSRDLPDESRRHWLSCFFVERLALEGDVDVGIRIRVHWRVPLEADSATVNGIRDFLLDRRLRRIRSTIADIDDMYKSAGEGGFARPIEVAGLQHPPTEFPMILGDEVQEILGIKSEPILVEIKDQESLPPGGPAEEIEPDLEPAEKGLLDWFFENHQLGHFLLARGLHTDTLVQCRSWISNRELLRIICGRIVREFSDGAQPDLVVGVGTSAIPIAVETALRLGCRVTFTFGEPPLQAADEIPRHPEWEVSPVIDGVEEHILLIDDIISFGLTASDVIEKIRGRFVDRGGRLPRITHCAVLRLGDEELTVVPDVVYFHLCHVRNVRYRRSAQECEQCQELHSLTREWEI